MKHILVSWSSAYDTLMHFDWLFQNELQPSFNASFLSSSFEKNHGGTGLNMSYNLALLWEKPVLLSSIGEDFIFPDIFSEKVNTKYIHREAMTHSANSIIISDNEDNRITAFHPWAMVYASSSNINYVEESIWAAIVSANHIPTMIEHARYLKDKKISFFIDPAQQISSMTKEEIRELISLWDSLIVNHYEFLELQKISGYEESELRSMFQHIIITYWAEGSQISMWESSYHIPAISVDEVQDTTGAWDAYRAWLLYAMIEWHDIKLWCQLGTILASYCVLASWSQHHHFSLWWVAEDMKHHFGVHIDLYQKRKY